MSPQLELLTVKVDLGSGSDSVDTGPVNEKLKERQALLSKQITDYMESVKM